MSTAPSSSAVAPLSRRVWQQFRQECRRQWFFVLLAWAVTVLAVLGEFSAPPLPSDYYWPATAETRRELLDNLQWWASLILPVWIAGRCVWASRPAAIGLDIHTRPMGRVALLLGQVAFLTVAIFAPRVVQDAVQVWGFDLPPGAHLAVLAGSALISLALIGAGAALASLAPTARWFTTAAAAAVGGALVWTLLVFKLPDAEAWSAYQHTCVFWAMLLLFACGACGTWIWKTWSPHRRSALVLVVATLVVVPLTSHWWKWDWLAPDSLRYTASKLEPVTAEKGKSLPDGAESLWSSLGIANLPSGYAASVSSFGPGFLPQSEAPRFTGSYSDFEQVVRSRSYDDRQTPGPGRRGLGADMVRSLVRRDPEWTWHDSEGTTRAPLAEIWQGASAKRATLDSSGTWRLGLEIHEPRLVLELPLRDLLSRHHRITLEPGLRIEIAHMELMRDSLYFHVGINSRWPGFLPRSQPDGRARVKLPGRVTQVSWCAVVLLDDAHRVAHANAVSTSMQFRLGTVVFTDRSELGATLPLPELRMKLTGLTFDEWAGHVRVQVWWPEPRGMVELEVPTKEVARLAKGK